MNTVWRAEVIMNRWPKKKKFIVVVCGLSIAGIIIVGIVMRLNSLQDPFSASVKAYADYPLYYPTKLPSGYKLDKDSVNEKPGVVVFTATNATKKQLFFSLQPKPKNSDVLYQRIIQNSSEVLDARAKVIVGQYGGQTIGSFLTDKTLVLTTAPGDVPKGALAEVLQSLKEVK